MPSSRVTRPLQSLQASIALLDEHQRLLWSNPSLQQQLPDARPASFEALVHPADRDSWQDLWLNRNQQQSRPVEIRLLTNRQPCWVRVNLGRCQDWNLVEMQDITGYVANQQYHAASQRGLEGLLGRLPVMIYRSRNDRDWTMEYVSEGCFELTGYRASDILLMNQRRFGQLIHPEDAERVWQQVQQAVQRQCSFEIHYRLFHTDGRMQFVCEKGCGVYSSNGSVLAVEGVIFAHDSFASIATVAEPPDSPRQAG